MYFIGIWKNFIINKLTISDSTVNWFLAFDIALKSKVEKESNVVRITASIKKTNQLNIRDLNHALEKYLHTLVKKLIHNLVQNVAMKYGTLKFYMNFYLHMIL